MLSKLLFFGKDMSYPSLIVLLAFSTVEHCYALLQVLTCTVIANILCYLRSGQQSKRHHLAWSSESFAYSNTDVHVSRR